nr:cysteine peptidase family C39 domain-containing protein [Psychroserpens algicola]
MSYLLQQLLVNHNYNIDYDELSFQIKSHPTYPSLHAITGVVDHFNIENVALDIPKTKDTLNQLPKTFLAQVNVDLEDRFVVVNKTKDNCKLTLNSRNKKVLSQTEFLKIFTGIILVITPNEALSHTVISDTISIIKNGLAIGSVVLIVLLNILSNSKLETVIFLILSFLGVYCSIAIIKQEQGENSILGNAFCSKQTQSKNCNAVLTSKGSFIIKNLKLSDLSIIYFTSLFLSSFILLLNSGGFFSLKVISLIALPITIYSLYYQSLIIKKWCLLCLSVIVIIWLQALIAFLFFSYNFELKNSLVTVLTFACICLVWITTSRVFKEYKTLKQTKIEYFRFKRNFDLFNNQLKLSKLINTRTEIPKEIILGNTNSPLDITIITNPMCGPCKQVHNIIEDILTRHKASVKLTIRFNIRTDNPNNTAIRIASRLLEINDVEGNDICLAAMHDIYGNLSAEQWSKKWEICSKPNYYLSTLYDQHIWCNTHSINFTPEILINGQSFPKLYDRSDLLFFMDDLIEVTKPNKQAISINES